MTPFRGSGPVDPDAARRSEESLRSIEAGGLPLAAQERLANLRAEGGGFFTSDLSVQEFLLVRQAGFRPLSQVMGSCFYNMGFQYLPGAGMGMGGYGYDSFGRPVYGGSSSGQLFELEIETEAWTEARRLALSRLAQEAKLAGADAVVGVRLERGAYDWSRGLIEFIAVGTAVASERYELGGEPVLSNLSGQEFAKLYANGYWPLGLVADTVVVYVMSGTNQMMGSYRFSPNQELPDFTQGIQHARKLAVSRVGRHGRELASSGVVGVGLEMARREVEHEGPGGKVRDMIVTVHALGTAIVELDGASEPTPVYIALPLNEEVR